MALRASPELVDSSVPANAAAALAAPRVIGLYGVPGCGKSYLMDQLKQELGETDFLYFEGSEVIGTLTLGGLDTFKSLSKYHQDQIRKLAIDIIKLRCAKSGKTGIVTGHFMFWDDEAKEQPLRVCTQADLAAYTHILYVNAPLEVTARQRAEDTQRARSNVSIQHLRRWEETEIQEIHDLCRENNILFATIYPNLKSKLASLIRDFQCHDENHNRVVAEQIFDQLISPSYDVLQTVLFFDADKTLAASDTGACFWRIVHKTRGGEEDPLSALFRSPLGYSYTAFRQAMLLYEESTNDDEFDAVCEEVASHTLLHPEMSSLLRQAGTYRHVCCVIVTCGLRRVWQKIIEKAGLSHVVKVVGGTRILDGFVVTPSVKECLISRAKSVHAAYTWAFGDSPLDLPMMKAAHEPIIVVGEQQSQSQSMKRKLLTEIEDNGLKARQVLLPNNSSPPLLDTTKLPIANLTERSFLDSIFQPRKRPGGVRLYHATDSHAAKLLSTPMRDDSIRGPPLQKAHENAGRYLATNYLVELIGTEELTMRHPQGNSIAGYQLLDEERTLIVPLMRGGQPMASGIFRVFPKARCHEAREPKDVGKEYLEGIVNVILVDSVINSGESMAQFVQHIQETDGAVRIIIVAGVIQNQAVRGCSRLRIIARSTELTVVALRLSANKYTGRGTTDTGNRLFNTTHLK
ncbi:uracil phosphoribosyltransferase-domain-containing protein [Aspergillus spinulosporus]